MNIYDLCVMLFLTIGVWVLVIYVIYNGNKTKNLLWSIDLKTSSAYQVTQGIKDRLGSNCGNNSSNPCFINGDVKVKNWYKFN